MSHLTGWQPIRLLHNFELRHGGFIPLCPWHLCSWLFLLGLAPFAFCFACLLDDERQIWLGDLRVAFWLVVFVSCSGFYDLPCYMTTCVHVEFISNCFFTCKDRALERDRPYRRKKKDLLIRFMHISETRWACPYRVGGNPGGFCVGFFGVAPAPFCVGSLFSLLAKRKSGRGICVSSLFFGFCLSVFLYGYASFFEAKVFHTFCTLFNRFSHCQDRALERDRPQQRKKKSCPHMLCKQICDPAA